MQHCAGAAHARPSGGLDGRQAEAAAHATRAHLRVRAALRREAAGAAALRRGLARRAVCRPVVARRLQHVHRLHLPGAQKWLSVSPNSTLNKEWTVTGPSSAVQGAFHAVQTDPKQSDHSGVLQGRTGELHAQAGATRPQRHVLAGALYLAAVSASKSSCCERAQASISFRSASSADTLTQPASGLPVTGQMLRRPAHNTSRS